jgi:hypothetical protein
VDKYLHVLRDGLDLKNLNIVLITTCRISHTHSSYRLARGRSVQNWKIKENSFIQKNVIGLNNSTNTEHQSIQWQRVRFCPLNI